MLAYHGTSTTLPNDIHQLKASTTGSFGSGFYLADKEAAMTYSDEAKVYCYDVDCSRLLRVKACFDVAGPFDLDTAALPLLSMIFQCSLSDAAVLFRYYSNNSLQLGNDVSQKVASMGYAGLYLDYGICFEVVVYPPFDALKRR